MIEIGGIGGSSGGFGAWGDVFGGIAQAVGNYAIQKKAMKAGAKANAGGGGYRPMTAMSWVPGPAASTAIGAGAGAIGALLGLGDPNNPQSVIGQGIDYLQGQNCQKFVLSSATQRARPISLISDVNPATGRTHWWRHVGQPILFSGDVSHCKRVGKLLGKASRKAGMRRGR